LVGKLHEGKESSFEARNILLFAGEEWSLGSWSQEIFRKKTGALKRAIASEKAKPKKRRNDAPIVRTTASAVKVRGIRGMGDARDGLGGGISSGWSQWGGREEDGGTLGGS